MNNNLIDRLDENIKEKITLAFIADNLAKNDSNPNTKEHVEHRVEETFSLMPKVENKIKQDSTPEIYEIKLQAMLPIWLTSINHDISKYIFYERLINNNLQIYLDGLYTVQRLEFIINASKVKKSEDHDSYAVGKLLESFSYLDENLISSYLKQIPGKFNMGHSFYISLGNAIYLILQSKLEEASLYLDGRLQMSSISKYDNAILKNLKSITEKDTEVFSESLRYVLEHYHKQEKSLFTVFLNLDALGLFNLASHTWGSLPAEPKDKEWDYEYIEYAKDHKPALAIDFSTYSPVLFEWLTELPGKYDVHKLINK